MKRSTNAKPSMKNLKLILPKDLLDDAAKRAKALGCSVQDLIRSLLRSEALNA